MIRFKYLIPLLLLALGSVVAPAQAQGPTYSIDRYTVAGGSGQLSAGSYNLGGAAGQPDAGTAQLSGGAYSVWGGFWPAAGASGGTVTLYLPIITKSDVPTRIRSLPILPLGEY